MHYVVVFATDCTSIIYASETVLFKANRRTSSPVSRVVL